MQLIEMLGDWELPQAFDEVLKLVKAESCHTKRSRKPVSPCQE
jgi:hypothetical protein